MINNMNSNVVYGAQVCHNGSTADYSQNYHHASHHDTAAALSYYQQATDLSSQTSNGPVPGATPTQVSAHYAPALGHMSAGAHQFPDHGGIISEPNGLSYTNLDTQTGYPTAVAAHQRGLYDNRGQPTSNGSQTPSGGGGGGTGGQPGSLGLAAHHHQGYAQYRDFSPDSVPSGHDMVSALTDCAVMRSAGQPTSQYPYLEPSLLSRRNGNHPSHLAYADAAAFTEMSCSQLNGSYHLNHLTSHLHHPPHHHHGRPGQNPVSTAAPVPTYKWMQVKRNVPKPGE